MIDKLSVAVTNKGTRKKRQREINRDETRMSGSLTRQKSGIVQRAREDCARGEPRGGFMGVAGSSCLPVSSPCASIGPLCHCQYSKELQIIWWLMVHSRTHWIYGCSTAMCADLNRYNVRFLRSLLDSPMPFYPFVPPIHSSVWDLLKRSALVSSPPLRVFSHLFL